MLPEPPSYVIVPATTYCVEHRKKVIDQDTTACVKCRGDAHRLWLIADGRWPNYTYACRSCGYAEFGMAQMPVVPIASTRRIDPDNR